MNFSDLNPEQKVQFLFNQIKRNNLLISSLENKIDLLHTEMSSKNDIIQRKDIEIKNMDNKLSNKNRQNKKYQSLVKIFIKHHELKVEFNDFFDKMIKKIDE